MEGEILVDGYNVIKNNFMFQHIEMKNLAEARHVLIRQLINRFRHSPFKVTVVFDGKEKREHVYHEEHIRVIYSRYGETADRVIMRLASEARSAGRKVWMYSDDEEIRDHVVEQGGTPQTTRQLTQRLNAAPSDVRQRALYRIEMRRLYGMDPSYKYVDYIDEPHTKPGKKKHKISKRNKKR